MATTRLDPVTLEVLRNRLDVIADEMQHVLLQSSHSVVIKEAGDATSAIFTLDGEAIAHSVAIPAHLGVMGPLVRGALAAFPVERMRDGDVYMLNDPYSGGTHLPDITLIRPIFHEGAPLALATALSHHQDVGGMAASSMPAHATEIFQEGLIIPPMRLYADGVLDEQLHRILLANVRFKDDFDGDLRGQLAAVNTGKKRFLELVEQYGAADVSRYCAALLDRAEQMTRLEIEAMPRGTYRFHDYLDHDGVDLDRLIRIEAAVTIGDGTFTVDFTGTDEQVQGPVNGPPSTAFSSAAYVLRAITDPAIPVNGGSERAISLVLPEGTVVNPRFPAPVSLRGHLMRRIVDVLLGALAQALPDRIPACSASINGLHSYSGLDPATGRRYGVTDTMTASGMGATPRRDGTDVIEMHTTNCLCVPTESLEMSAPVLVRSNRLRADSGGPGLRRGGLGVEHIVELRRGVATSCFRHERHRTSSWGLAGGGPGAKWHAELHTRDGQTVHVPGKTILDLQHGDVLLVRTGGGGGFGDPLDRDPEAVLADWEEGKVSTSHARGAYGVVIDVAASAVDPKATIALRRELRDRRRPIPHEYGLQLARGDFAPDRAEVRSVTT